MSAGLPTGAPCPRCPSQVKGPGDGEVSAGADPHPWRMLSNFSATHSPLSPAVGPALGLQGVGLGEHPHSPSWRWDLTPRGGLVWSEGDEPAPEGAGAGTGHHVAL